MLNVGRPLRVAVLCSRRAPGLGELIARSRRGAFRVVGCLTSEEDFAERALAEANAIRWISHPVRAYHRARQTRLSNRTVRARCDTEFEPPALERAVGA